MGVQNNITVDYTISRVKLKIMSEIGPSIWETYIIALTKVGGLVETWKGYRNRWKIARSRAYTYHDDVWLPYSRDPDCLPCGSHVCINAFHTTKIEHFSAEIPLSVWLKHVWIPFPGRIEMMQSPSVKATTTRNHRLPWTHDKRQLKLNRTCSMLLHILQWRQPKHCLGALSKNEEGKQEIRNTRLKAKWQI